MVPKLAYKSILAGLLIGFAGCIYMNCENKIVGALLFSLGLCAVILLQANLYTGKIGYVNSVKTLINSQIILVYNLLIAFLVGCFYAIAGNNIGMVGARFEDFIWYQVVLKGILTGIAIYLGVELYKKSNNFIPVILSIMGFILGGGYHVVADAAYLGAYVCTTKVFKSSYLLYIILVAIGNSLGSLLIRFLQMQGSKENAEH